ncbi:hypothetical protein, partial [Microbispora rosea]
RWSENPAALVPAILGNIKAAIPRRSRGRLPCGFGGLLDMVIGVLPPVGAGARHDTARHDTVLHDTAA